LREREREREREEKPNNVAISIMGNLPEIRNRNREGEKVKLSL
jgi:hypothetical protein